MRTGMDQAGRCGRDRTGGAGKGRGQRERERTLGDRKKKNYTFGRGCAGIRGVLQGGRRVRQSVLDPITLGKSEKA